VCILGIEATHRPFTTGYQVKPISFAALAICLLLACWTHAQVVVGSNLRLSHTGGPNYFIETWRAPDRGDGTDWSANIEYNARRSYDCST
jgi:hypothetical protein